MSVRRESSEEDGGTLQPFNVTANFEPPLWTHARNVDISRNLLGFQISAERVLTDFGCNMTCGGRG